MLTRDTFQGPWAGLPVAWTDNDEFDEERYRQCVADCCRAGVPGVYTGGTTGEFYAMEWDEFQAVSRATVEECKAHNVPAMIGCSSTYTRGVLKRVEYAVELGAQAVQVAMPYWMELEESNIVPFFEQVGHSLNGLALSIYETTRCKNTLTVEQHRAIKAAVPNYLMVKANHGTIGNGSDGCAALSEFVNVFVGESLWASLVPHGVKGGCSSMIYWNPKITLSFWQLLDSQQWDAAAAMHAKIQPLFDFLVGTFVEKGYTDTAFDRLGGLASGFLKTSYASRAPYPSTAPEDVEIMRKWYFEHFPEMIWE